MRINHIKLLVLGSSFLCSTVAGAAQLYSKDGTHVSLNGEVKGRHYFSGDKAIDGDNSQVKLMFSGDTKINSRLTGYSYWEYNIPVNNTEGSNSKATTRIAYAGIKIDDDNSLNYGRNYGIMDDISGWTGIPVPEWGGESYDGIDNFMTYRTNNLLTYRNKNLFSFIPGLELGIQAQGKNDGWNDTENETGPRSNNPRGVAHQNGNGLGSSLIYHITDALSAGASYANSDRTLEQKLDHRGDRATGWNAGFKYDANRIYLAAYYGAVNNMHYIGSADGFSHKARGFEVLAQYHFDSGFTPSVLYTQGTALSLHNDDYSHDMDYIKFFDLAGMYNINKNLELIVEYKLNLLNRSMFTVANHISTDDITNVTLKYSF
ncbi:TPA: porin [Salmonella enterica]|uniref:Porin n=1 Tax=Salmonella enterica TaxID=28901 RepID=A0A757VW31_SALER|nr:porin [Salmonella enterica]